MPLGSPRIFQGLLIQVKPSSYKKSKLIKTLFLTLCTGIDMSRLPRSTGQSKGRVFSPLLPPALLTNASKIGVTWFRALENRDILCRNFPKHGVSFPQKMHVPQILSLQQSELWSWPSLLPCAFMCKSSAIVLRNMELKVCSSLAGFSVMALCKPGFSSVSWNCSSKSWKYFFMHQVTDLCGACTQLCQVSIALTPSHALNPTENDGIISLSYLLNVSNSEVNWLYWSITHLLLLRNMCLSSCQGKAVWIIKTASQLTTGKFEDNN